MKRKLPVLIGLATLALIVFLNACSVSGAMEKLDRFEDNVEQKLDDAKDAIVTATAPQKPAESPAAPTAAPGMLTAEDAKALALTHAGLSADQVSRLKASYEIDDGIPQYDVGFYYNSVEYDYEIHAETGKILSFDKDTD